MACKVTKIVTKDIRPVQVEFTGEPVNPGTVPKAIYSRDSKKNVCMEIDTPNRLYKGELVEKNRYLVMKNRNSNELTLILLDNAELKAHTVDETNTLSVQEPSQEAVSDLNKTFGGKKVKRRIEQQIRKMKMNVEDSWQLAKETIADLEVEESNLGSTTKTEEEEESLYRPPINRNASTRDQVYPLEKLVPIDILNSLEEQAQNVLTGDLDQFKLKPFIRKHLLELQKSTTPDTALKCKILLYVDCLLYYLSTPTKCLTKNFKACSYSIDADQYILDNFSSSSGTNVRSRPLSLRDKCICHVMVLLMLALNYTINLEEFSQEIRLGIKKLQEIGRVLAFSVAGNLLIFKLPLPAPFISRTKRKRK